MRAGEGNVEGGGYVGKVAQSEAWEVLVVVWGETMSMQKNFWTFPYKMIQRSIG